MVIKAMAIKAMEIKDTVVIKAKETRAIRSLMVIKEDMGIKDMVTKEVILRVGKEDMVVIQITIIMERRIIIHTEIEGRRVVTVIVWRHVVHAVEHWHVVVVCVTC